jgi:hypothetical protein
MVVYDERKIMKEWLRRFVGWPLAALAAYGLLLAVGLFALLHHGLFVVLPEKPAGDAPEIGGPGWSYKFEDATFEKRITTEMKVQDQADFRNLLDKAGADAWELVGILPLATERDSSRSAFRFIFKKPTKFTLPFNAQSANDAHFKALEIERKAEREAFWASISNSAPRLNDAR